MSTIWGDHGLLRRMELRQELRDDHRALAELQRDNARLYRELKLMERDPVVVERLVAEELQWAREGTVIYTFDP